MIKIKWAGIKIFFQFLFLQWLVPVTSPVSIGSGTLSFLCIWHLSTMLAALPWNNLSCWLNVKHQSPLLPVSLCVYSKQLILRHLAMFKMKSVNTMKDYTMCQKLHFLKGSFVWAWCHLLYCCTFPSLLWTHSQKLGKLANVHSPPAGFEKAICFYKHLKGNK